MIPFNLIKYYISMVPCTLYTISNYSNYSNEENPTFSIISIMWKSLQPIVCFYNFFITIPSFLGIKPSTITKN